MSTELNHQTKAKAERIRKLIRNGKVHKEILDLEFRSRKSNLKDHLDKAINFYTDYEFNLLMCNNSNNINEVVKIEKELYPSNEIFKLNDIEALKELINYKNDILNLIKNKKINEAKDSLIISDKIKNTRDYKITSIRISPELEKEFNKFCNEYKAYSKTQLFNQAIEELIKKYK